MKKHQYIAVLAALLACSFSGCTEESSVTPEPDTRPVVGVDEACGTEARCADGLFCIDGFCTTAEDFAELYNSKCSKNSECGAGMQCVKGTCQTVTVDKNKCSKNADCEEGKICYLARCTPKVSTLRHPCSGEFVCADDLVCSPELLCLKGAAAGEACDEDTVCSFSQCVEGVCTVGERDRDTDGDGISDFYDRCDKDTDGDNTPDCKDLDADGDTIPDKIENNNQTDIYAEPVDSDYDTVYDFLDTDSDDNGIPDEREGCPSPDDFDNDGFCSSPVDLDGDNIPDYIDWDNDDDGADDVIEISGIEISGGVFGKKCGNTDLLICDNDGKWTTLVKCAGDTPVCDANSHSCLVSACTPDTAKCDGNVLTICDSEGIWGTPTTCTGDTPICSADDKACKAEAACTPDTAKCDGNVLSICDSEGKWGTPTTCSGDTPICDADNKSCVIDSCTPDTAKCDGNVLSICDSEGKWGTPKTCSGDTPICDADNKSCVEDPCEPDTAKCDDNVLTICTSEGKWGTPKTCTGDTPNCNANTKTCDACLEGEAKCDGNVLTVCGSDGKWGTPKTCDSIWPICNADLKSCVACNPGAAICTGGSDSCVAGTADNPWDSDGDTIPDYNDFDSDGDTISDEIEGITTDTDEDKIIDRYSLDSDGDTIPDAMEASSKGPLTHTIDNVTTYCFRSHDCDNDGVADKDEILCPNGKYGLNKSDTDEDGYTDLAERAAAEYVLKNNGGKLLNGDTITSVSDLVCNPELTAQDVFEFYFELPYQGPEKDDDLQFDPAISKLDVVFNMDTTQTMGGYIARLKSKVKDAIIPNIRKAVDDVGFAVTRFDDFPTNKYGAWTNAKGGSSFDVACNDLPFVLYQSMTTDANAVSTAVNQYKLHDGEDAPESGYEALWQIVKGDDKNETQVSWTAGGSKPVNLEYSDGELKHCTPPAGTWGCVGFRPHTLPLVIHFTDALSHDNDRSYTNYSSNAYDSKYVHNPHYSKQVLEAYKEKGARIITLDRAAIRLRQLRHMSIETDAIVPVCAFRKSETEWRCGENKCCTNNEPSKSTTEEWFNEDWIGYTPEIEDRPDSCELSYAITNDAQLEDTLVDGIRALVAYGTYEVSTAVRGDPTETALGPDGNPLDTACFIKKIVATTYVAPPEEPEKSCTPVAVPTKLDGADYNNGFTNFAPGRSRTDQQGSQLHFQVIAQNDNCIEQTNTAQIFKAYIDVINPTTDIVFDTREVSIIVPPKLETTNIN